MLKWAGRARQEKRYEYATDLCKFIVKYYPETKKAELALEELEKIKEDKLLDTEDKANTEREAGP